MGYPKWSDRVVLVLAVLVWLASNGPVRSQTFGPPQVILDSIGSAEPFFEDANADGIPDLFIQQDSVVQIYLNDGTGVFTLAELVQI
ncbi:MAG: VCBS repeat-containing protein, partial [Flavobacteriales bacterium]|nr:VCBS repeat-containing protein [Flavobacteriales bacterium]